MDVKCPKCQTEYELDDARMRPGGVTVKCAGCENVFRVKRKEETKRPASNLGVEEERSWLIRLHDGEIKVCRELATLQRWIIAGVVDPKCEISRTGKKWKALSELKELSSFFAIAAEAKEVAQGKRPAPVGPSPAVDGSVIARAPEGNNPPEILSQKNTNSPSHDLTQQDEPYPRLDSQDDTVEMSAAEAEAVLAAARRVDQGEVPSLEDIKTPKPGDIDEDAKTKLIAVTPVPEPDPAVDELSAPIAPPLPRNRTTIPQKPTAKKAEASGPTPSKPSSPPPNPKPAAKAPSKPSSPPPNPKPAAKAPPKPSSPPPNPVSKSDPAQKAAGEAKKAQGNAKQRSGKRTSFPPPPPGSVARKLPTAAPSLDIDDEEEIDTQEASGPVGGLKKGIPTAEAAFAASAGKKITSDESVPAFARSTGVLDKVDSNEFKDGRFVPTDGGRVTIPPQNTSGGAGKWVVLVSFLLLGGAAAAMYFVFAGDDKKESAQNEVAIDAASLAESETPTSEEMADAAVVNSDEARLEAAKAALARSESGELQRIAESLDTWPEGQKELYNARLTNALAQHSLDRGLKDPKAASSARKESRKLAKNAKTYADAALKLNPNSRGARLAKADALRLSGAASREVERWLRHQGGAEEAAQDWLPEENYVRALLYLRDKRNTDANLLLTGLSQKSPSTKLKYRQAIVAATAQKFAESKSMLQEILALDPEHSDVSELLAFVESKIEPEEVATNEGGGEEETGTSSASTSSTSTQSNAGEEGGSSTASTSNDNSNSGSGESSSGGGGYDKLLERADRAAETGNCNAAISLYEKALDDKPAGVAALTGLGYCHLDAQNYASAQARFRAALGISPRYQDALWGVAEGYQQQGLKKQAIEGYQKFIQVHPSSRRAQMAKRQIERLGGDPNSAAGEEKAQGGNNAGGNSANSSEEPAAGNEGADKAEPSAETPKDKPTEEKSTPSEKEEPAKPASTPTSKPEAEEGEESP